MRPSPLRGMTFNLKFPSEKPPHAWPERRPLVAEALRRSQPHIVGTQEGHYQQLREITADVPYQWIGLGRAGGSHDEFNAVLYDPEVADPLEYDHFWLSGTPDRVGSRTFGNRNIRMATWVRFAVGDSELVWVNTHLDHESEQARIRGVELLAAFLAEFTLPVVLSGDFNCPAGSGPVYRALMEAGLLDAWQVAGGPEVGTYGGWGPPRRGAPRIDWLLVRGLAVKAVGLSTYHMGDEWPSDHFPVWADLIEARPKTAAVRK